MALTPNCALAVRAAFLTVCLLIGGCAAPLEPGLATEADMIALWAMEERLEDGDIASLVPQGARAEMVRALLGPPYRRYFNTWEYLLAGFNRPRTLLVRFSDDDVVKDAHVLERRGAVHHRRIAAR